MILCREKALYFNSTKPLSKTVPGEQEWRLPFTMSLTLSKLSVADDTWAKPNPLWDLWLLAKSDWPMCSASQVNNVLTLMEGKSSSHFLLPWVSWEMENEVLSLLSMGWIHWAHWKHLLQYVIGVKFQCCLGAKVLGSRKTWGTYLEHLTYMYV